MTRNKVSGHFTALSGSQRVCRGILFVRFFARFECTDIKTRFAIVSLQDISIGRLVVSAAMPTPLREIALVCRRVGPRQESVEDCLLSLRFSLEISLLYRVCQHIRVHTISDKEILRVKRNRKCRIPLFRITLRFRENRVRKAQT